MRIPIFIVLSCSLRMLIGQNWQPFTTSETFSYQSDTAAAIDIGYRVDSFSVAGTDTFYYLNTVIEPLGGDLYLKYGPQFWQKAMRNAGDGLFYFTDPASMALYTRGAVGDTWEFNFDDHTYATIIAADTQTVLGELDSIKIIETTDGYFITLSKAHGLIRFPVAPGIAPAYCSLSGIRERNLGNFFLGFKDYFDVHVGDVFEYHYSYFFDVWTAKHRNIQYTITAADVSDTLAVFSMEGKQLIAEGIVDPISTLELIDTTIEIRPADHSLTTKLPRAYANMRLTFPFYWYLTESIYDIFQNWGIDSLGNQITGDAYCDIFSPTPYYLFDVDAETAQLYTDYFVSNNFCINYTAGLGLTRVYHYGMESGGSLELTAYVKDGDTVGTLTPDSLYAIAIHESSISKLKLYPNPASEFILISIPQKCETDLRCEVISVAGNRIPITTSRYADKIMADLRSLPPGYYLIKLMDNEGKVWSAPFCKSNSTP